MVQPLLLVYFQELPHTPAEGNVADWVQRCRSKLHKFKQKVESRYSEGTLERLLTWHQAEVRQAATLALGFVGTIRVNGIIACRLRDEDTIVRQLAADAMWSLWFRADSHENNQELQRLMRLDPHDENVNEILAGFAHLIGRAPHFAEAYNQRAVLHFRMGNLAKSIPDCEKTLRLNPYHFGAACGLAQCFMKQKKLPPPCAVIAGPCASIPISKTSASRSRPWKRSWAKTSADDPIEQSPKRHRRRVKEKGWRAMSARFDRDGIGLSYPENWKLEFEDSDNGWTISLQSSETAFLLVSHYEDLPELTEVARTTLNAMQAEYEDLEADEVFETVAGQPAVGHDIRFFSLDLTNTCWVAQLLRAPRHGPRLLAIDRHGADQERPGAGGDLCVLDGGGGVTPLSDIRKLAWVTDPHLNFLDHAALDAFCAELAQQESDAFLITGDIGEAPNVAIYLNMLDSRLARPIYFVVGNHDFYRGSIPAVRAKVSQLCAVCPNLHYLPAAGVITLSSDTCLIGHDGWADGRFGDYAGSTVRMNDWILIEDLAGMTREGRLAKLHALGDEAATHFRAVLPEALGRFRHIVVAIHVPPFREGCWYSGRPSSDEWLPHISCKAAGDVLKEMMAQHPDRDMTVYCGHTHGEGEAQVLPNLRVVTGGAEYRDPKLQRIIVVP